MIAIQQNKTKQKNNQIISILVFHFLHIFFLLELKFVCVYVSVKIEYETNISIEKTMTKSIDGNVPIYGNGEVNWQSVCLPNYTRPWL